jgi:hypothetical protein
LLRCYFDPATDNALLLSHACTHCTRSTGTWKELPRLGAIVKIVVIGSIDTQLPRPFQLGSS